MRICAKFPASLAVESRFQRKSKAAGGGEEERETGGGGGSRSCSQTFNELHTLPPRTSRVTRDFVPGQNEIGERGTLGGGPGDIRIIYRERRSAMMSGAAGWARQMNAERKETPGDSPETRQC